MFRMQHLPLVARWSCMCKHRRPADGVKVDPHEALTVSCTTSNHPYTHLTMQGVRYAVVLVALLAHAAAVQGGKIQATFSYKLRGRQTTLAPDGKPGGLALGSQVVMHLDLLDRCGRMGFQWFSAAGTQLLSWGSSTHIHAHNVHSSASQGYISLLHCPHSPGQQSPGVCIL